jgi:hypothetical protein
MRIGSASYFISVDCGANSERTEQKKSKENRCPSCPACGATAEMIED